MGTPNRFRAVALTLLSSAPLLMAPTLAPPSDPDNARAPEEPTLGALEATAGSISGEISPCIDFPGGGVCNLSVAVFASGADPFVASPLDSTPASPQDDQADWAFFGLTANTAYQLMAFATDGDATVYTGPYVVTTSDAVPSVPAAAYPGVLPTGEHAGFMEGAFSVGAEGSAVYEIPIAVPPGTAGVEPALALVYDSARGNGTLGMGFALSGLGEIARCLPNLVYQGHVDPIDFDDDDVFCLDGDPLVAVDGPYGANNTEYRTKLERFAKIVSYGGSGTDPSWFRVWSKDGQILDYGASADARLEVQGRSEARVWAVDRVADRFGNYLTITYDEDVDLGEHWPAQIDYTGNATAGSAPYNRVVFEYNDAASDPRPDPIRGFFAGGRTDNPRRLTHIETYARNADASGLERVFDYALQYEQGATTGRSRLVRIDQCDSVGVCLPPTQLVWSDAPGTTTPLAGSATPGPVVTYPEPVDDSFWDRFQSSGGSNLTFPGDLDGDGLTDIIRVEFDDDGFPVTSAPEVSVATAISNGDGTYRYAGQYLGFAQWFRYNQSKDPFLVGDVNGDGRTDLVHIQLTSELNQQGVTPAIWIRVWLSLGDGTFQPAAFRTSWELTSAYLVEYGSHSWGVGDADGDGRDDILAVMSDPPYIYEDGTHNCYNPGPAHVDLRVAYSNGDGTFDEVRQIAPWLAWPSDPGGTNDADCTGSDESAPADFGKWRFVDANGDGLVDIVGLAGFPWIDGIYTALSTGKRLEDDGAGGVVAKGFDIVPTPEPITFAWGGSLGRSLGGDQVAMFLFNNYFSTFDINGDGNTDLLFIADSQDPVTGEPTTTQSFWTALSRGDGSYQIQYTQTDIPTFRSANGQVLFGYYLPYWSGGRPDWRMNAGRVRIQDINGDGLDDVTILRHVETDGSGVYSQRSRWDLISSADGHFSYARTVSEPYFGATHWADTMCGVESLIIDFPAVPGSESEIQGDVNGDGKLDWICVRESYDGMANDPAIDPEIYTLFADGNDDPTPTEKSDLLVEIRNGADDESVDPRITEITYQTLNAPPPAAGEPDLRIYTPSAAATSYPLRDVQDGRSVVAAYAVSDGLGGLRRFEQHYQGLRDHDTLRASLGFESRATTDVSAGITQTTEAHQDFPLQGLPARVTASAAGRPLRVAEHQWVAAVLDPSAAATFGERYTPREDWRVTWEWEPNDDPGASAFRTTVRDFDYDEYDNVLLDAQYWGEGEIAVPASNDWSSVAADLFQEVSAFSYFTADEASWLVSRVETTTLTADHPETTPIVRTSTIPSYWVAAGGPTNAPEQRIEEPDTPADEPWMHRITSFGYDAFGNVTAETVRNDDATQSRTQSTEYDPRGQFPIAKERASDPSHVHRTELLYEPRFGRLVSRTDPIGAGRTTSWQIDGLGRVTLEQRADGTTTTTYYTRCDASCRPEAADPGGALAPFIVTQRASGGPPTSRYYDALGRVILEETLGFNQGTPVLVETGYDALGRVVRHSRPYYENESFGPQYTTTEYDVLDRVTLVVTPDATPELGAAHYDYNGLTTTITDPLGHPTTSIANARGWVTTTIDALGQTLLHEHDAFGRVTHAYAAADPAATEIWTTYDRAGHKKTLDDPDLGRWAEAPPWAWTYTIFGEVSSVVDPKGGASLLGYDGLGRQRYRLIFGASADFTTWSYDTGPSGLGLLDRVERREGSTLVSLRVHGYDTLGRPVFTSDETLGEYFATSLTYDADGRLAQIHYPSGREVQNVYDARGYLKELDQSSGGPFSRFYRLQTAEPDGRPRYAWLGDALYDRKTYDAKTGRLASTEVWSYGAGQGFNTYLRLVVGFDFVGNLVSQQDHVRENDPTLYAYDALNRLETATRGSDTLAHYGYDALGNLTSKLGVGDFDYGLTTGGAGSHAVTALTPETPGAPARYYHYDANGNLVCRGASAPAPAACDGTQISYDGTNKPTLVHEASGDESQLVYGTDDRRVRQIATQAGVTTTTHYVGRYYERISKPDGTVEHIHHAFAGGVAVAQIVDTESAGGTTTEIRFLHRDHLGSVRLVTRRQGNGVIQRLDFDPHGQRSIAEDPAGLGAPVTPRGFTGHEHLDSVGLIHMNGRVYDPELGRMLSPDPIVQAPYNLQSYNRYSYVMNNPLSYTDPSGYKMRPAYQYFNSSGNNSLILIGKGIVVTGKGGRILTATADVVKSIGKGLNNIGARIDRKGNITDRKGNLLLAKGGQGLTAQGPTSVSEQSSTEAAGVQVAAGGPSDLSESIRNVGEAQNVIKGLNEAKNEVDRRWVDAHRNGKEKFGDRDVWSWRGLFYHHEANNPFLKAYAGWTVEDVIVSPGTPLDQVPYPSLKHPRSIESGRSVEWIQPPRQTYCARCPSVNLNSISIPPLHIDETQ
jgi:RHS repeat-associated protein